MAPDAAICPDCAREILDPFERRFRYAFASCARCGPGSAAPEGDDGTAMCAACRAEHDDPSDRHFQARGLSCHRCGPRPRLVRCDGRASSFDQHSLLDDVDAVAGLILKGRVVLLKGSCSYQLACDATNEDAVARLRAGTRTGARPWALMARDLAVVERYCPLEPDERRALESPAGPIVILRRDGRQSLPASLAPGLRTLGFLRPTSALHVLALRRVDRPVIMTSATIAGAPPIRDDETALRMLGVIADYALLHDRPIGSRVPDSVVRVAGGRMRLVRRARFEASFPIALPPGFARSPPVLALGDDRIAAFCTVQDGEAMLSPPLGDLDDAASRTELAHALSLSARLGSPPPQVVAADPAPGSRSAALAREHARRHGLRAIAVPHDHAHLAACLVDNERPIEAPPVLGIIFGDGAEGADGTVGGGAFLIGDYRSARRLATLKPVAPWGGAPVQEPWRHLYAHLMAEIGWAELTMNFAGLALHRFLAEKRRSSTADAASRPPASSCARFLDAVAAALDICREGQSYAGEAAARLDAIADRATLRDDSEALAYPFTIPLLRGSGLPYIEPRAMWDALLGNLVLDTPAHIIAARFHKGFARAVAAMARRLATRDGTEGPPFDTIALAGGSFQNRVLFEEVARRLTADGFTVLSHARVPGNESGLALGRAAVAAAAQLEPPSTP